jgi:hypothetical protein
LLAGTFRYLEVWRATKSLGCLFLGSTCLFFIVAFISILWTACWLWALGLESSGSKTTAHWYVQKSTKKPPNFRKTSNSQYIDRTHDALIKICASKRPRENWSNLSTSWSKLG